MVGKVSQHVVHPPTFGSPGDQLGYLTLDDVAVAFRTSRKSVLRRIARNEFPPFTRIGRRFIWRKTTIEAWLAARESLTGVAPRRRTRRRLSD